MINDTTWYESTVHEGTGGNGANVDYNPLITLVNSIKAVSYCNLQTCITGPVWLQCSSLGHNRHAPGFSSKRGTRVGQERGKRGTKVGQQRGKRGTRVGHVVLGAVGWLHCLINSSDLGNRARIPWTLLHCDDWCMCNKIYQGWMRQYC